MGRVLNISALPQRNRVNLPTQMGRHRHLVRRLQDKLDEIQDDLESLGQVVALLRDEEAEDTTIAPHSSQHISGGSDELYFSDLERSSTDQTRHDAYRLGPHVSDTEHAKLAGTTSITWVIGVGPVLTVNDGSSDRRYRLDLLWNASAPTPGPMMKLTEIV